MGGVAGGAAPTLHFRVWVHVMGKNFRVAFKRTFVGNERILGRDVLNQLEILFRGPTGELVIGP